MGEFHRLGILLAAAGKEDNHVLVIGAAGHHFLDSTGRKLGNGGGFDFFKRA